MTQVAAVILTDEEGKILICKRGEGGSCAHLWEMPGGKVEQGETPAQAAVNAERNFRWILPWGLYMPKRSTNTRSASWASPFLMAV